MIGSEYISLSHQSVTSGRKRYGRCILMASTFYPTLWSYVLYFEISWIWYFKNIYHSTPYWLKDASLFSPSLANLLKFFPVLLLWLNFFMPSFVNYFHTLPRNLLSFLISQWVSSLFSNLLFSLAGRKLILIYKHLG